MTEFKTSPSVDVQNKGQENGVKRVAEGTCFINKSFGYCYYYSDCLKMFLHIESRRRNHRESSSDLPKASKRQSTGVTDSPTKEKTSKPRTRKSSNKNKDEIAQSPRIPEYPDPFQLPPPPSPSPDNNNNNNIPKKSRRHKTKEHSSGVPSKSRTKAHSASDSGSPAQSKSRNTHTTFDETEHDLLL